MRKKRKLKPGEKKRRVKKERKRRKNRHRNRNSIKTVEINHLKNRMITAITTTAIHTANNQHVKLPSSDIRWQCRTRSCKV